LDYRELQRSLRLAVEQLDDRGHGVELELLVGVELELHGFLLPAARYAWPGCVACFGRCMMICPDFSSLAM
jgi:hypothetical protein